MKKSSCIQEITPKFVNLKTLSMIHMTLSVSPILAVKMDIRSGTSAVLWWLGRIRSFWLISYDISLSTYSAYRLSCTWSRLSPDSRMEYPADQLQLETIDNIQLNITSSILQ